MVAARNIDYTFDANRTAHTGRPWPVLEDQVCRRSGRSSRLHHDGKTLLKYAKYLDALGSGRGR